MSERDASPLPSIERAVQDRAKSLPSDLAPEITTQRFTP